jgi:hypothetical protein
MEYDRLVEAGILGPEDRVELLGGAMVGKEPQHSPHARARLADDWIVNLPDRRLEVYRSPASDAAAAFGWRDGNVQTLGPGEHVATLAAPGVRIAVADLLP